jgi:hypothetical protein
MVMRMGFWALCAVGVYALGYAAWAVWWVVRRRR